MKSDIQKYIIQSVIMSLQLNFEQYSEQIQIKKIGDNIDEQIPHVIICGISSSSKVFPMTDDYQFKLDIAIRSWIADDENGQEFERVCKKARNVLRPLSDSKTFRQIFDEQFIVGVVEQPEATQVTEDSNILTLSYLVYASF